MSWPRSAWIPEVAETEEGIGIVGAGRVGTALARRLADQGWPPGLVASRRLDRAAALAELVGAQVAATAAEVVAGSGVTLLAVPDGQLGLVSAGIAELLPSRAGLRGKVVAHCAGIHGPEVLSACAALGAATAALHPLAPIPDGEPACLEGAYLSLEGDPAALLALEGVAIRLGLRSFRMAGVDRALYHAAAALAAVLPVLLERQAERAVEASGAPVEAAAGLRQLLLLAAGNVRRLGPVAALSGPTTRRDRATTHSHEVALATLDPRLAELYRLTLELAAVAPELHRGGPRDG